MGMTIEERIAQLVRVKHYAAPKHYETLDTAIDTMQKYQKIQEIVNSKTTRLSYEEGFRQIKKVVEDGNIN